ncbi:MAG: DUF4198 domain-containing protein [Acidobacteriota bacterium]
MTPRPPLVPRLTIVSLLAAGSASAHDFWIEPSAHRIAPADTVDLRLMIGERFQGEPYARNPAHLRRFEAVGPSGRWSIAGRPGQEPAGRTLFDRPGAHVVGYHSHGSLIEMPADDFDAYLAEEGLDHVLLQRAEGDDDDLPVRELFSRCAKSLLTVGPSRDDVLPGRLGLPLELMPEKPPWRLPIGETLPLQVVHDGRPLADALVRACRAGAPDHEIEHRTDATGRIELALPLPGRWLIKCVHVRPAPPEVDAEWESLWASLTFEIPDNASAAD